METLNAPAGLMDNNFEFFTQNGEVFFLNQGSTRPFNELPETYYNILLTDLLDHPRAFAMLALNGFNSDRAKVEKWAVCNLGDFDLRADLTSEGVIIHEHIHCPNRGNCPFEGIVCQPIAGANGNLTPREIQIIKLVAVDMLDKQIADQLKN